MKRVSGDVSDSYFEQNQTLPGPLAAIQQQVAHAEELSLEEKEEAREHLSTIAAAAKEPQDEALQKPARESWAALEKLLVDVPDASRLEQGREWFDKQAARP